MIAIRIAQARADKEPFEIEVDGKKVPAYAGETVSTALQAAGIQIFFRQENSYPPSKLFCGMGTCRQCLIMIDDQISCLACQTLVYPGMKVRTSP
jgi:predicted molibdopterin-dependent oxidoreductase YjgC